MNSKNQPFISQQVISFIVNEDHYLVLHFTVERTNVAFAHIHQLNAADTEFIQESSSGANRHRKFYSMLQFSCMVQKGLNLGSPKTG